MSPIAARQAAIVAEFQALPDWESRYKRIIARGKSLGELPEPMRDEEHKVRGCQSQIWLHAELRPDGAVAFRADSDALIVKGLVALLLEAYSGSPPAEILGSPPDFLRQVGLDQHLSPSRANGLFLIVKQIMFYAQALAALAQMRAGKP
jgi:cysteine desulfuration protein SufE